MLPPKQRYWSSTPHTSRTSCAAILISSPVGSPLQQCPWLAVRTDIMFGEQCPQRSCSSCARTALTNFCVRYIDFKASRCLSSKNSLPILKTATGSRVYPCLWLYDGWFSICSFVQVARVGREDCLHLSHFCRVFRL